MFQRDDERRRTGSRRRVLLGIAILLGLAAVAAPWLRKPARWTLSFEGFGPVKIGMTVREAEKALGMKLVENEVSEPCHYAWREGELPGVGFMVLDGKIVRIDVTKDAYRAESGARVGAAEEEIRRLHPQIQVERHPYDDDGHYLVLADRDRRYGMIFETNGKVVTSFRAGERKPVGYIEGCE